MQLHALEPLIFFLSIKIFLPFGYNFPGKIADKDMENLIQASGEG